MNIADMIARSLKVSLEDNAQVEVNFNIDTDENGSPVDDGSLETPEEELGGMGDSDDDAAREAESDVEAAEDEVTELEEAKNSLESLTEVVTRYNANGNMTRMGVGMYQLALESIVPSRVRAQAGCISMENRHFESKHHAALLAQIELEEVTVALEQISMEAKLDWIKKTIHKVDVFFRSEKALLKRANALLALARTGKNEHANNETITVNGGKKTLPMSKLLSQSWDTEKEFLTKIKSHNQMYIDLGTLRNGYEDEFVEKMFPNARKWSKDKEGKPAYTLFGMKLVRGDTVVTGYPSVDGAPKESVPTLTPAACIEVLQSTIEMLELGKVMKHNLDLMATIIDKNEKDEISTSTKTNHTGEEITVHNKTTYPDGYLDMYKTLCELGSLKNKVVTETLNYVNYSLTDRQFV